VPRVGEPLPSISAMDPALAVQLPDKVDSSGSAFSVDGGGYWLTARHVVDGCRSIGIVIDTGTAARSEVAAVHPSADLAMLRTRGGAAALDLVQAPLHIGDPGFHFGFPGGDPGEVQSSLLGRRSLRISGRYRTQEPVLAWSEVLRVPGGNGELGGISGGPLLDMHGQVAGVNVAATVRRGRLYTAAPVSMRAMLQYAGLNGIRPGAHVRITAALDGRSMRQVGDGLRSKLTVAKVICLVSSAAR